ncbi:hypothetical protein P6709_18380 [Jeotgalibacillus sp. ET6]|uniref:hypothetical protein n=1 Tax=Jeotgalibacillus sp. ET6 TaxID=3037260 RepID=UPI002418387E|nr:hypothetical protein [Jeotgalibacillus sp. ET6]MDG5473699.1 hypothetical protein [Jeotgalibacillus sp. ET6]
MKVSFLHDAHQKRFEELRFEVRDEKIRSDPKCLALLYLIAGDSHFFIKASPYFNTTYGVFDSEAMFEIEEFGSSSLKTLEKTAVNLFSFNDYVTPAELVDNLENEHFQLVLNAILLQRDGLNRGYEAPEEKMYS